MRVDDTYRFDNFIVDDSNSEAFSTLKTILNNSCSYNPVIIQTDYTGVGVTHLLRALYYELTDSGIIAEYMAGSEFCELLVRSRKRETTKQFSKFFSSIDCLIIDDYEYLLGKNFTAFELYQKVNTLVQSGKPVVIGRKSNYDRYHDFYTWIDQKLDSPLIVDISPLKTETVHAYLHKKVCEMQLDISEDELWALSQKERNPNILLATLRKYELQKRIDAEISVNH